MDQPRQRGRPVFNPVPCPPPRKLPFRPVFYQPPDKDVECIMLSETILGFRHHFDREARVTIPCPTAGDCEGCRRLLAARWTGFAAGMEPRVGAKPCIVPFPESCYRAMQENGLPLDKLRGTVLRFHRMTKRKNAPLVVSVAGKVSDMRTIPPAFDVQEALMRLWGVDGEAVTEAWGQIKNSDPNGYPEYKTDR